MASMISPPLAQTISLRHVRKLHITCCKTQIPKPAPVPRATAAPSGRRQLVLLLTASTAMAARESPSIAQDIPLFGLRKKLKSAEEEAEQRVREGFNTAEKGLETVEKGIETAERGIETAETEIETAVSFGGLAQAGVVAGAEVVGVLVATSIVNGILGPEVEKS